MRGRPLVIATVSLVILLVAGACTEDKFYSPGTLAGNKIVFDGDPPYELVKDSFLARFSQQTDILAVIDNSGSMSQEIAAVKDSIGAFHSALNKKRLNDYQIAITTVDAYTHEGTLSAANNLDIVSSSTPNAVSAVQAILTNIRETGRSYWEQGLKSAHLALARNAARLLRPNVDLAVIILTDEDDYSCTDAVGDPFLRACPDMLASYTQPQSMNPRPWVPLTAQSYKDYFASLGRTVLFYPIVGVPGVTCQESSKGSKYIELQALMGTGFVSPICNDQLATNFTRIASMISSRGDCYQLTRPVDSRHTDIAVKVNGTDIPSSATNGFQFDTATNAVCFSGSFLPPQGAAIEIEYLTIRP